MEKRLSIEILHYKDVVRNIQAIQLFKNTLSFFAHQENKGQTENIVKLATAIIEFINFVTASKGERREKQHDKQSANFSWMHGRKCSMRNLER